MNKLACVCAALVGVGFIFAFVSFESMYHTWWSQETAQRGFWIGVAMLIVGALPAIGAYATDSAPNDID